MKARKTGKWLNVRSALTKFPVVVEIARNRTHVEAEQFLSYLKDNIRAQNLSLAPLTLPYKTYKQLHGLDPRILIASGEYVDKLTLREYGKGKDYKIFVGAFAEDTHNASGQPMDVIATWLEYGTEFMPARPHIHPSWEMYRGRFDMHLRSFMFSLILSMWR